MKRLVKILACTICILIGLSYGANRYAEKILFNSLNDEVTASTPCQLKSDVWSVTLLTLSAYAKNARIECPGGKVVMSIPEITASFNLKKISNRKISIDPLILKGGDATGLLPGTEGYAFINRLAAPSKNPHAGGIKVRLENFYVKNVSLVHDFSNGTEFLSKDASMHLIRHESDAVTITTSLSHITVKKNDFSLPLTSLSAEILSTDDLTTVKSLSLSGDSLNLNGNALIELTGKEALSGNVSGSLDSKTLIDEALFKGTLLIESLLKGTANKPSIDVSLHADDASIKSMSPSPLSARAAVDLSEDPKILIHEAHYRNSEITLSNVAISTTPLKTSGVLSLKNFSSHGTTLTGSTFFSITENEDISASMNGLIDTVSLKGFELSQLTLAAKYEHGVFSGDIYDKEKSLSLTSTINEAEESATLSLNGFKINNFSTDGTLSAKKILSDPTFTADLVTHHEKLPDTKFTFSGSPQKVQGKISAVNLDGDFSLNNSAAVLKLAASHFEVSPCQSVSAQVLYSFNLKDPLLGNGSISDLEYTPDCHEAPLTLSPESPLTVKGGVISLQGRTLHALKTKLNFSGNISLKHGFSLSAQGDAKAASLGILPQFDNVDGLIRGVVSLTGPLSSPQFHGELSIDDGVIEQESSNMIFNGIKGVITLNEHGATTHGIKGFLNGGEVLLSGSFPLNTHQSGNAKVNFKESFFQVDASTSFDASGNLDISTAPLTVKGDITLHTGDFIKSFNLKAFIREKYESLFASKTIKTEALPNIPIDLHIVSPGQFFISSNLLDAELKADLIVKGTLSNPQVAGKIETIRAEGGLRGRRFDISLGEITFTPDSLIPYVRFFGEATLVPAQLDSVLVLLQIEGPLSKPSVEFISDRNLSQSEIIKLITGGQSSSEATEFGGGGSLENTSDDISINDTLPFFQLPSLVNSLTRIDSIAIEPRYDPYTGNNEPLVIARKKLWKGLELVGESVWRSSRQTASAKLVYNLNPRTNLVGIARTIPSREGILLGSDITFTLLSRRPHQMKVSFQGLRSFSQSTMMEVLNLNGTTMLHADSLKTLEKRITQFLVGEGFLNAHANVSCNTEEVFCKDVSVSVFEGGESYFQDIQLAEESLPEPVVLPHIKSPTLASEKNLNEILAALLVSLRNEGYVGARIKGSYSCSSTCSLIVKLKKGKPISFVFDGHHYFREIDFLNSIRLFSRKTPLGSNTPRILIQNMITMYKESGFPFVHIDLVKEDPRAERIIHHISVHEGEQLNIKKITIAGISEPADKIKDTLRKLVGETESDNFFEPTVARKSTLDAREQFLQEALLDLGYEGVSITQNITPLTHGDASLEFKVQTSGQSLTTCYAVIGSPAEFERDCSSPVSEQTLKAKALDIKLHLKNLGYRAVTSEIHFNKDNLSVISINPGPLSHLGKISITGNKSISDSIIENEISELKEGDTLTTESLRIAQERLLKLGLFQRVSIKEASRGNVSDIAIEVQERPLQTLELGTGYSTGLGLHLFGEASDRELFSDGKVLSLRLDTFLDSQDINEGIASLRFTEPSVFGTPYSLIAESSVEIQNLPTYEFDLNRTSIGASLYRNFEHNFGSSVGIQLLNDDLKNVSPGATLSSLDNGIVTLGILSGDISYDGRDNALLPTRGGYINIEGLFSDKAINSDAEFYGGNLKGSYSIPLSDRWSLFSAGSIGKKIPFGSTEYVPITQRYYLGGRGSVRGYIENSLGPRGLDESVIGGEELIRGNVELHYLLYDEVSLQTFYDIGKITLPEISSPLEKYIAGAGVGIRYLSPIGPLGFDVAHGLNDVPGSRNIRFTFEIGLNF